MMKKVLIALSFLFSLTLITAQTTYVSNSTGNWSTTTIWTPNGTPTGSDYVTISAGTKVTLSSSLTVSGSLTIEAEADLDMTGYALSKSGSGTILIQSDATGTGELIFTGSDVANVTVQCFIDTYNATDSVMWHQIGIPITDGTTSHVFQNHNPPVWVYRWEYPNQSWQRIQNLGATLENTAGFFVSGEYDYTIDWGGTITAAGYTLTDPSALKDHYPIFGNPFTSSYDAMSGGSLGGTNLYDEIWVWNPLQGHYASHTLQTGGNHSGIVAPGQGFFAQVMTDGSASLTVDPTKRTFSDTNNFWKAGRLLSWDDNYGKGIYAMIKVSDGKHSDGAFVNFGENGTPGFENGYDGFKMFGNETSPQLYLAENDQQLSIDYIQSLSEEGERVVQMDLQPGITGEHTLTINLDSLPDTKVILEDLSTGTMHNFNDDPFYTFNASKGDDPARFLLHFSYGPTGIENPADAAQNTVKVYAWDKAVYISNSDNDFAEATIHIYDLLGRELVNTKTNLGNLTRIPVEVNNSYLVVQVIKGSNVVTEKVFVK